MLGEAGSGKSSIGRAVIGQLSDFNCAIASYDGSIKQCLLNIADQLDIRITIPVFDKEGNEKGEKPMTADQMKVAIAAAVNNETLIVCDDAHRWAASLRYWLEELFKKGCVLVLLSIYDLQKDIFLKLVKVAIAAPTDLEIREVMSREAIELGLRLSPAQFARLQAKAGTNLMLAKRVIQEESLGMATEAGEHTQYVDISPFITASLCAIGIVRFIGLGMGDRTLYIVGGVAMLVGLALKYLGRGLQRETKGLGR